MAPRKIVKKPVVKADKHASASEPAPKRQKKVDDSHSIVNDVLAKFDDGELDKAEMNEAVTGGDKILDSISESADQQIKPDSEEKVTGKQSKITKRGKRQTDNKEAVEAMPNPPKAQPKNKKKVVDDEENGESSIDVKNIKRPSKRPRRGKIENDKASKLETRHSDSEEETIEDPKLDDNNEKTAILEKKGGRKRNVKNKTDEAESSAIAPKKDDDENLSSFDSDFEEKPKRAKSSNAVKKSKRAPKASQAEEKPEASKSAKTKIAPKKEGIPDVNSLDFSNNTLSSGGKQWNLKITSWNVNGIRAWLQKDGLDYIRQENPDIMCVQETKCADVKLPDEIKKLDGYHCFWLSGDKDGYSGVGLLSKNKPIDVKYGIGMKKHDNEGRVIIAEYEQFYLVTSYVPNAGKGLVRLDYRQEFDADFRSYLKKLDADKPVILCGDLNVAHEEIDLAKPKSNKKNAGFTQEERDGFTSLLSEGFVDSFRHLYPDEKDAYTFWTYMMNARAKNIGWRLDYFVISQKLLSHLCDNVIRKDVHGSDHCPVTLFLAI